MFSPVTQASSSQSAPAANSGPANGILCGTLSHWNYDRGFGFLARDDGGADVFVHFTELAKAGRKHPQEGDRYGFEVATDPKSGRLRAINVVVRY